MENGWYLACPRCGKLDKGEGWTKTALEVNQYTITVEDGFVSAEFEKNKGVEHTLFEHDCGFETEVWHADDLLVKVENGKIVSWGLYFESSPQDLKKIAEKNGLEVG